jgi:hypothetical protein
MAKLASGKAKGPRMACKKLSHKRVENEKGAPCSRCVSGGANLLHDQGSQPGLPPAPAPCGAAGVNGQLVAVISRMKGRSGTRQGSA